MNLKKIKLQKQPASVIFLMSLIGFCLAVLFFTYYLIVAVPVLNPVRYVAVKRIASAYLEEKYGDQDFRITGMSYITFDDTFFDTTPNLTGYYVDAKCKGVTDFTVFIDGVNPGECVVDFDDLLENRYVPNTEYNFFEQKEFMEELVPLDEFKENLLISLQREISSDISEISDCEIRLDIPDDFGRIPTLEELKGIELYKIVECECKYSEDLKLIEAEVLAQEIYKYLQNEHLLHSEYYTPQSQTNGWRVKTEDKSIHIDYYFHRFEK